MLALGKYPEVTLLDARRKRDEARALVKIGKHPTREKDAKKLRQIVEGEHTFEKVARHWMELKGKNLNEKYHKQSVARMEQHIFPMIGALPITEITIPDVARVVEKIGQRGIVETAHRMKQVIAQVFRYAAQRGLCQFNPAADMRDILPPVEEKHYPCIHPRELPKLLQDMAAYQGDLLTNSAMKLLLLTAADLCSHRRVDWREMGRNRLWQGRMAHPKRTHENAPPPCRAFVAPSIGRPEIPA